MKRLHTKNESGLVSIIVVLLLMIMLGLITIGLSRLSRREQRQALDRQLSTQAFYAAETGTNDAINALKSNPLLSASDYTTKCNGPGPPSSFITAAGLNNSVDGGTSSYTCLFVDPTPRSFKFSNVDTNNSKIVPITPGGSDLTKTISSIRIGWQDKGGGTTFSGCSSPVTRYPNFPAAGSWWSNCDTGVLRVDLVPVNTATTFDRNFLLDNTITIFLYPANSVGVNSVAASTVRGFGKQGSIPQVRCTGGALVPPAPPAPAATERCNFTITGLAGGTQVKYMLRLRSIYRASTVSVIAFDSSNNALELKDGQAVIDVTGKTKDVLRRTQSRIPLGNFGNAPEFGAQTVDTFCKRFSVAPPSYYSFDSSDTACDVLN